MYSLYKNDHLYYVGLAVDLRRRIKQHLKDKHAGRWNRFSLYLVRKVDHIKEIESLLLRIADPAGNKRGGRLRRAKNLDRQLRRMMQKRQQEELDEIFTDSCGSRGSDSRATRNGVRHRQVYRGSSTNRPLKGVIVGGKRIYAAYKGKRFSAVVYNNGRIKFQGKFYNSPSAAGSAVVKRANNGWSFWHVRKDGELVKLSALRKHAGR